MGATGLIGRRLVAALGERGDDPVALARHGADLPGAQIVRWDPAAGPLPQPALAGVEAVVNLAGAPVAGRRWTDAAKREIRESRLGTTRRIVESLGPEGPRTLVNASAVGYYGSGEAEVDEDAPPGSDYLAEVAAGWEAEARAAEAKGVRVVLLRTGVVLAPEGGALPDLLRPARIGLGGPVGGGRQWLSWVHVDDVVAVILWALDHEEVSGPLNVVAGSVRQRDFAACLGRLLGRPALLPTPAIAVRLAFGEGAQVVLEGQRVAPAALRSADYRFRHPELEEALRAALAG